VTIEGQDAVASTRTEGPDRLAHAFLERLTDPHPTEQPTLPSSPPEPTA